MAEDVAKVAADVVASVTGPGTPDAVRVVRSSRLSEWSLFLALVILAVFALILTSALEFHSWIGPNADKVIEHLGWALRLSIIGILLVVLALCSPYIGRVEASAGAAQLHLEGRP